MVEITTIRTIRHDNLFEKGISAVHWKVTQLKCFPVFRRETNHQMISFKERGARYALLMLSDEQKKRGVISASLGNHAQV